MRRDESDSEGEESDDEESWRKGGHNETWGTYPSSLLLEFDDIHIGLCKIIGSMKNNATS